jgi:hypothetical protein
VVHYVGIQRRQVDSNVAGIPVVFEAMQEELLRSLSVFVHEDDRIEAERSLVELYEDPSARA